MQQVDYKRYFTLDEAAALLPEVQDAFEQAHKELQAVKDDIILYKRVLVARKKVGNEPTDDEINHMRAKYDKLETLVKEWVQHFNEQGIILRDLEKGLIDFPYKPTTSEQVYLLCWHCGEDGLFYFHKHGEGFMGRKPISLLPE